MGRNCAEARKALVSLMLLAVAGRPIDLWDVLDATRFVLRRIEETLFLVAGAGVAEGPGFEAFFAGALPGAVLTLFLGRVTGFEGADVVSLSAALATGTARMDASIAQRTMALTIK